MIDGYLEGVDISKLPSKRRDWILQAREVLVPACTLSERIVARFDPDCGHQFQTFTKRWRKDDDKLHSFNWSNDWQEVVKDEMKPWKTGKGSFHLANHNCTWTNKSMEIAEDVVQQYKVPPNGTARTIALLEILGSLLAPWAGKEEWLEFKVQLARWKARKEGWKKDDDILRCVTETMKGISLEEN